LKRLQFVDDPAEQDEVLSVEQETASLWLGGLYDGEGSIIGKTTLSICQSSDKNAAVCERIRHSLKVLGFSWKEYHRAARQGHCQNTIMFNLHGGFRTVFRFMRLCNPARRAQIIGKLLRYCSRCFLPDKVKSIRELGRRTVHWLETETGNYIVWGYGSKNSCQYLNRPVPQGSGLASRDEVLFIPGKIVRGLMPQLRLHCTIDLAGMDPQSTGDYTVFTVAGFDSDGRCYVIEVRRARFSVHEVIEHIFDIWKRYKLFDMKIEKDAHARVLLPFLTRESAKKGVFPIMVPIQRDNRTSKKQRISSLQPWFKAGIIRFADDIGCKLEILQEITRFSQTSTHHDDFLDTLADQMQNREGGVLYDVIPVAPRGEDCKLPPLPFMVQEKFLGFDPMTHEEQWQGEGSGASAHYDRVTGL